MPSDSENLKKIARGDRTGFNELFGKYKDHLFQYLSLLNRGDPTISRLFSDLFLQTISEAGIVTTRNHYSQWLFKKAHEKSDRLETQPPLNPNPALDRFNRLSVMARELVFLHHCSKLDFKEIAPILGDTEEELPSQFAQALLDMVPPKSLPKGNRIPCAPMRQLAAGQVEKKLNPKDKKTYQTHLARCTACNVELSLMQHILEELDAADWPLPTASIVLPLLNQVTALVEKNKTAGQSRKILTIFLISLVMMGLSFGIYRLVQSAGSGSSPTDSKKEARRNQSSETRKRSSGILSQELAEKIEAGQQNAIKKEVADTKANYVFPSGTFLAIDKAKVGNEAAPVPPSAEAPKGDQAVAEANHDSNAEKAVPGVGNKPDNDKVVLPKADADTQKEVPAASDSQVPSTALPERHDEKTGKEISKAVPEVPGQKQNSALVDQKPSPDTPKENPGALKKNVRFMAPPPRLNSRRRLQIPLLKGDDFKSVSCDKDPGDTVDRILGVLADVENKEPEGPTLDPTLLVSVSSSYLGEQSPEVADWLTKSDDEKPSEHADTDSSPQPVSSIDSYGWVKVQAGSSAQPDAQPAQEAGRLASGTPRSSGSSAIAHASALNTPCTYIRVETPTGSVLLQVRNQPQSDLNPVETLPLKCCPVPPH